MTSLPICTPKAKGDLLARPQYGRLSELPVRLRHAAVVGVCEVHDKFNEDALNEAFAGVSGQAFLIAHPESPLPVLQRADYVGSTSGMLNWVKSYQGELSATILSPPKMASFTTCAEARPDLNLVQAPIYAGCQCNSCPYMKLNTVAACRRRRLVRRAYRLSDTGTDGRRPFCQSSACWRSVNVTSPEGIPPATE